MWKRMKKKTKNVILNLILKGIISVLLMIAIIMNGNILTVKRTLPDAKILRQLRKVKNT